jgi:hypothetical protein
MTTLETTMDHCYDDGVLRAALDGMLPQQEREALQAHVAACPVCAGRLEAIRASAERSAALLAAPDTDVRAALGRMRGAARESGLNRRRPMTINRMGRRGLSAVAGLVLAIALLALPPVQAAADQLLKVFRVQSVVFVPVDRDRMRELEQLDFDEKTLFVAEPTVVVDPGEPTEVASAAEASALVGFPVAEPNLPDAPLTSGYRVQGQTAMEFQVNVDAARQLLQLAGVTDVTLPDALGSGPIRADVPPSVISSYRGANYELKLVQGTSPAVSVPEGVELSQLGVAMLRLLGTSPDQAAQLSSQIDWSTTFVFPFPADVNGVRTVNVDGVTALLATGRDDGRRDTQLYWQRGERFYVLSASGDVGEDVLLGLISSLR